jgi:uncharacterized membrane protein YedE/YeeE
VSVIASVRPDAWNFPLFLHVLGAMLLVGSLVLTAGALIAGWRGDNLALKRLGVRSLTLGVIPSYLLMRVAAEWISDKEGWNDVKKPPSWIDVGYSTADGGLLLLIIATVLAGLGMRRARRAEGGGGTLFRISAVLTSVLLIAYIVAIWAMTTKPT